MATEVFKDGNRIGIDKVRVHRGGNRIDGVSHDNEIFQVDLPVPNRSKIDLSFDRKISFNMGQLIPIYCKEVLPGDTFHIAQAHNLMFAPVIAPIYHRIDYRTWFFFVPFRLLWKDWKDFICNNNPASNFPTFTSVMVRNAQGGSAITENTLLDYFDLPVQHSEFGNNGRPISCAPFRAYNMIWNEFYRDEFKQTKITQFDSGGNASSTELNTYIVRHIGWEKDYFTTCQVNPQMGQDVNIPTQVVKNGNLVLQDSSGIAPVGGPLYVDSDGNVTDSFPSQLQYKSGLGISGTINDLRMANHLQKYRDKLQLAGARYNEQILAEFGVVVPDYRIQRPEYIGGYASPVEIGRVMQTTPVSGGTPLGAYAGSAQGSGRMDFIHYSSQEHGLIIGLCAVVPRTGYDQGIPRELMHHELYDFYHPDFATLGDQAVYKDEIYLQGGSVPLDSRFGYTQRYNEYRYENDKTNGEFRTSLAFWHMNREFASTPVLGSSFIECNPTDRVFAVQDGANKIYAEIYHEVSAVRPIPISVVPTLDD